MEKRTKVYICFRCNTVCMEHEMYKIQPPSLCNKCFTEIEKVVQEVKSWTREGWETTECVEVPKDMKYRIGIGLTEDFQ